MKTDRNSFVADLVKLGLSMPNTYPKALANFMFREIIEDAHVKYNISQDDVKAMCKEAVNRAYLFFEYIVNNPEFYKKFAMYAVPGLKWDEPDNPENNESMNDFLRIMNAPIE